MKHTRLFFGSALIIGVSLACSDDSSEDLTRDAGLLSPDASSAAGAAGDAGASTTDAAVADSSAGQADVSAPDADGDASTFENSCGVDAGGLRLCSASVTQAVDWGQAWSCDPQPQDEGCPLRWGCDSFEVAREIVARCDAGPYLRSQQSGGYHGLLVIQEVFGLSLVRGYYDAASGALLGYWEQDDTGHEGCSGTVPEGVDSFADPSLTDAVTLCAPDGGPWPDAG